jgi:hypothetical protein
MRSRHHAALALIATAALWTCGCDDFDPPPPAPPVSLPSFGDAAPPPNHGDAGLADDAGADDDASALSGSEP